MKQNAKLVVSCLRLELEVRKLKSKLTKITNELNSYKSNNEFLSNENAVLKQINRKRYVLQEDKMHFLTKRENKLQLVEQMVTKGEHWKTIKNKIMEDVK